MNGTIPGSTFSNIDYYVVVQSILSVKSKAIGLDGSHPKFFKCLLPKCIPYVTHVLNSLVFISTAIGSTKTWNDIRANKIIPYVTYICLK